MLQSMIAVFAASKVPVYWNIPWSQFICVTADSTNNNTIHHVTTNQIISVGTVIANKCMLF